MVRPYSPTAETAGLNSVKCRFESVYGYTVKGVSVKIIIGLAIFNWCLVALQIYLLMVYDVNPINLIITATTAVISSFVVLMIHSMRY